MENGIPDAQASGISRLENEVADRRSQIED
jgi:hypothetical protein